MKRYIHYILIIIVLSYASYSRIRQVGFGLPDDYHPDERIASHQISRFLQGDLRQSEYRHPPFLRVLAFCGLRTISLFIPVNDANRLTYSILSLRIVSVISGIMAVLWLYFLAREFLCPEFSLLAMALYAVLPLCVIHSKYGTPDSLLSFLFIFVFWLQIKLYQRKTNFLYFSNGLFIMLACTTKYNAVFLFISFLVAHFLAVRDESMRWHSFFSLRRLKFFFIGLVLGFFWGFPVILFGMGKYLINGILYEKRHLFEKGHFGITIRGVDYYYVFHFIKSVLPATGLLLFSAVLCGLIFVIIRCYKKRAYIIVMAGAVPYYTAMELVFKVPVCYERYVLPLLGLYILFAVVFCQWLSVWIQSRVRVKKGIIAIGFALLLGTYPFIKTTRLLSSLEPDTREEMKQWIKNNVPAHCIIFEQWPQSGYYPNLFNMNYTIVPNPRIRMRYKQLLKKADYVLVSNLMYDRYFDYPQDRPDMKSFYETIFRSYEPVFQVTPSGGSSYMIHNPSLRLFKTRKGKQGNDQ